MSFSSSPTKRSYRQSSLSISSLPQSSCSSASPSRPQSPSMLRRPASSIALRSPTPNHIKRPNTPSGLHYSNLGALHSTPNLAAPSSSPTSPSYSGFIRVSIRVKPSPNAKLSVSPDGSITTINEQWTIDSTRNAISTKEVGEFVFDNIYHGQLPNSQIFDNSVKELIDQVMAGYNGTVFAYGMTGSGKTYSMQGNETNPGIIPLSAKAIFDHVNSPTHSDRSFAIKVAYLEIYNEHLHDLLSPSTQADDIKLRDDPVKGVRAMGLKEIPVSSPEELLQCIQSGDALRRTEGTEFNSKSSRSHAIVQISVESTPKTGSLTKTYSTLYLCDLAGSERAASQTERRKEGAYINKSLLTLGTVIAKLFVASTSPSGFNAGHVPYRDSKLTRLLQPALSGKSLVSILCTIDVNSPPGSTITNNSTISNTHVETISTLRFAARAKNIMVNVKKNEEQGSDSARIIEKLVQQVESLKLEVAQLKSSGGGVVPTTSTTAIGSKIITNGSLPVITAADQQQYITQIAQLEAENKILHERVEHLTRLCDDNRLEEVILGADEDGSAAATTATTSSGVTSPLSTNSLDEENVLRKRIDEYESYIAHLEKQLEKQLYQASINNSININNLNNSLNISKQTNENASSSQQQQQQSTGLEVVDYTSPSLKSESSTFGVSTNGSAYGKYSSISSPTNSSFLVNPSPTSASFQSQGFYNELISELRDEIAELKESNNDKDRIISALRSINKRKENLSHALSSSSVGGGGYYTSSSSSTSSSPLSPSIPSMLPIPLSTSTSSSTTTTTTTVTSGPASLNSVFSPSGISSPSLTSSSSSSSAYNRYYFSSTSSSPPRTTVAIDSSSSSSSLGIGTAISTNSHNGTTTMSRCNSDGSSNTSIESIKGRRMKSIDNNSKLNVVVGYSNITTNNNTNNNEGLTLSPTSSITPSGIRSPQRINNTVKDKEFMNKEEEEENISKNDCESVGERTLTDISVN